MTTRVEELLLQRAPFMLDLMDRIELFRCVPALELNYILESGVQKGCRPGARLELCKHISCRIMRRRRGARVDPKPELGSALLRVLGPLLEVQSRLLRVEERQEGEIRLVGEGSGPEHMEETRILGIAWRLESRGRSMFAGGAKEELILPVGSLVFLEAVIRVKLLGAWRLNDWWRRRRLRDGRLLCRVERLLDIDILPVVEVFPPKPLAVVQAAADPENFQAIPNVLVERQRAGSE